MDEQPTKPQQSQTGDDGDQSERERQILDAAFEEFAAEGFRGATIKRIARRAKLQSQALIYWYFPTKEALFQAALGRRLPILQLVLDQDALLDRPPSEVLPLIARAYLAMANQPVAQRLLRLIVPEVIRRPEQVDQLGGRVIARVLDFVKRYLARQIELGRLRPHDVRASARAFIGMILPQLGGKLLLPSILTDGLTDDAHIEAIIEIFLHGLESQPADAGQRTTADAAQ